MSLPILFDRWLNQAVSGAITNEERASCLNCGMTDGSCWERPQALATFHPDTKCCTYTPALRNFQIGAILADTSPEMAFGRDTLRERLKAKVGVTPLGFTWLADYEARYDDLEDEFGMHPEMRCPHYIEQGGLCGIWRHRNSVCSTWFCRHEDGHRSLAYWEAVRGFFEDVEHVLMWHAMQQMGVEGEHFDLLQDVDNPKINLNGEKKVTRKRREKVWGHWIDHEEAFFLGCHDVVANMSWDDMMAIAPSRLGRAAESVADALADLNPSRLPPILEPGDVHAMHHTDSEVWVRGYRGYDATPVHPDSYRFLRRVGGMMLEDLQEQMDFALPHLDDVQGTLKRWVARGVIRAGSIFGADDAPE